MRTPIRSHTLALAAALLPFVHAVPSLANVLRTGEEPLEHFDSGTLSTLPIGPSAETGTAKTGLSAKAFAAGGFEENKGQVYTTAGEPATFVRYRFSQGNTQLFLLDNGIAFQFNRTHYHEGCAELMSEARYDPLKRMEWDALGEQLRTETYRMDMLLDGADPHARVTADGRSSDYTNYYTYDVLGVHTFGQVTYHDVWPGIDWVVYTTEKGMKYDFVVRPGADPSLIRLRFEHYEELYVDDEGNLVHGNRLGRFTEQRPVSFQDGKEVPTRFILEGDVLRFAMDGHDRNVTLIIDPVRIWGTYYGGPELTIGHSCTVDADDNVYLVGYTRSPSGIAATGGHQSVFGGGIQVDAFLAKFTSNGIRLWGTYYGGTGNDAGYSCVVANDGNIYMAGHSDTPDPGLIASGGHQNTHGGLADAMLVKFAPNGTRIWGTYYGGTVYEEGWSCALDSEGNVYLSGLSASTSAISTPGAHQITHGGGAVSPLGAWDAFLVKFNSSGVRQWGTYYGGTDQDRGHSCAVDGNDNVYLAGWTISENAIATTGAHQPVFGGGLDGDAFIAKFNSSGVRQWGTYYGGVNEDRGHSCVVDGSGNVYLAGFTDSPTDIGSGGHQNMHGGGKDAFLVKFNDGGARLWGTYFGGPAIDQGHACTVDGSGNVYLAGQTASTAIATAWAYQPAHGGVIDAFLAKFGPDGEGDWCTYYGGNDNDQGYGCVVDGAGSLYLAGFTSTSTPGVIASQGHQNTYPVGAIPYTGFLVKFEGDVPTVGIGALFGPYCSGNTLTVPYTAAGTFNAGNVFTAQLSNASGSFTAPVAIGSVVATTSGTITCTIPPGTQPGAGYRIRVVSSAPVFIGPPNAAALSVATAPYAGQNASVQICANAAPANLFDLLVGADPGGFWTGPDGLPFSGVLDPSIHLSGLYTYTVSAIFPCVDAQGFLSIVITSCTGIDDAASSVYGRWLGQDVDGSHMIDAPGLHIGGWEILDELGRQVHAAMGQAQNHRLRIQFRAATGSYLLRLHTDQGVGVLRIHHAAR